MWYNWHMDKHRFNLILPAALWQRIKALATRNRRPVTQEIIIAIEGRLKEEEAPSDRDGKKRADR